MKTIKLIVISAFAILFLISLIDLGIREFGTKKYYQLEEQGLIVKDSLTNGILSYGNSHSFYFKWNVVSVKEIENK